MNAFVQGRFVANGKDANCVNVISSNGKRVWRSKWQRFLGQVANSQ